MPPTGTLSKGKLLNLFGTGLPQREQKFTVYPLSLAYDEINSSPRSQANPGSGAIKVVLNADPVAFLQIEQWHWYANRLFAKNLYAIDPHEHWP